MQAADEFTNLEFGRIVADLRRPVPENLGLAILHKLLAALPEFCAAVGAAKAQAPGGRARAMAGQQGRESLWIRDPW